jgi:outer membrane protein assembly factor BamA
MLMACVMLMQACSISRRIPENETYFCNHELKVNHEPPGYDVPGDELLALSRQQPNRRILWTRFNLRVYAWLVPPKALERSLKRVEERCPEKNARRAARGKPAKECKSLWSWLAYTVGEPPMLLDTSRVNKAAGQMQIYLQKKGYFHAAVTAEYDCTDSTTIGWKHRKKCRVEYQVEPGEPYSFRNIRFISEDAGMRKKLDDISAESLLRTGDRFDAGVLDQERERITAYFNNTGYYQFTKDYIVYDADSAVGGRQVDLVMRLVNPRIPVSEMPGEFIKAAHRKFFIGNVTVHCDYNPLRPDDLAGTPTSFAGIQIVSAGDSLLNKQLIGYTNSIIPGELYQRRKIDLTYKRFSQLGVTRSVTIQLNPRFEQDSTGIALLDANILLSPARSQSLSFDPRVTNRAGNMGIYTNFAYRHRNVFRGAENLEIRIVNGFEASQVLGQSVAVDVNGGQIERNFRLNTFEIGPDISISIPRLFPLGYDRFRRSSEPRTTFHALLNYQTRPDYERTLSQLSMGYSFIENPDKVTRFNLDLAEISLIKIKKSPGFEEFITRLNDVFLANSYRDHLITASRIVYTLNTQKLRFQRLYFFYRTTMLEAAGNLLRLGFQAGGGKRDEFGSYEIAGIRFAQYIKTDHDFRVYLNADDRNGFVFRAFGGVGRGGRNLDVLPFERSYFVGGANGIRAWQARTLGPGSYRDTLNVRTFNNIGDVKLEFNVEYRFKLTKMFQAALFADAGNIWLLRPDANRPGADFRGSRFAGEIAVGAGFGVRLDFEFFLVRFDIGYPLKDPLKVQGERWAWQPKEEYNAFLERVNTGDRNISARARGVFNVGIGFPF